MLTCKKGIDNTEEFSAEVAEQVHWYKRWEKVFDDH
jgi:acetyl-CoA synthetase-like protein